MPSFKNVLDKLEPELDRLEQEFERPPFPTDIVEFIIQFCGFTPTNYQRKLVDDPAQFIACRWSRQSGKSHIVSAMLLALCVLNPGFNIIVVAPSLRQSKIIIRKITSFLRGLPRYVAPKPLKTKIEFWNGSRLAAFPNNPDTIRGEPGVNLVYIDEFNYVADDSSLYDAVIFTLATTNGKFLTTSTPGSRDSMFYRMCTDNDSYGDISRHHVTYRDALEPNGPLKAPILDKLKHQLSADPWRWQREMEAEFAEDEDAWLPMSLITSCLPTKDDDLRLEKMQIPEDILLMRKSLAS